MLRYPGNRWDTILLIERLAKQARKSAAASFTPFVHTLKDTARRFIEPSFTRISLKECQRWVAIGGLILVVIALLVCIHASPLHEGSALSARPPSISAGAMERLQREPRPLQENEACAKHSRACVVTARDIPVVKAAGTPASGPTATAPPLMVWGIMAGHLLAQNIQLDHPILWLVWFYALRSLDITDCSIQAFSARHTPSALPSLGDWDFLHAWPRFLPELGAGSHQWRPEVPEQGKVRGLPLYRAPPPSGYPLGIPLPAQSSITRFPQTPKDTNLC